MTGIEKILNDELTRADRKAMIAFGALALYSPATVYFISQMPEHFRNFAHNFSCMADDKRYIEQDTQFYGSPSKVNLHWYDVHKKFAAQTFGDMTLAFLLATIPLVILGRLFGKRADRALQIREEINALHEIK